MKRLVVFLGYDERSNAVFKKVSQIKHLFDDVSIVHVPEIDSNALQLISLPSVKIETDDFLFSDDELIVSRDVDRLFVDMLIK
ncbi:MAG: hypothetical protein QW705_07850 [Zestosphaera sp.]